MWYWVIGFGMTGVAVLLMWVAYLIFCGWLVNRSHNDTKCLRDAAVAARAFPGAGVAGAIARAFRPDPVVEVAEAAREVVGGNGPPQLPAADGGTPAP